MVINRLYLLIGVCILLAILGIVFSLLYSVAIKQKAEEPQTVGNNQTSVQVNSY